VKLPEVRVRNLARLQNLAGPQARCMAARIVRNDAAAGPTRVDVYDDIGGGGWFGGGISASDFVAQLADIDGDVEVHINSGGGDVFDGIAMYNALAGRSGTVTTVVDGIAASIASIIAQAGQSRVIAPGAMMMIHDALSLCIGNAGDMRETADLLDQVSDNLASVYASRGGTAKAWRAAMQAESWYTAQDAVDAGLADKLAERPAAPDDVANHDFSVFARVPEALQAAAKAAPAAAPAKAARPRVLGIESMPLDGPLPVHHTATADEPWDGPAAVKAMPNDDAVLRYCHAWQTDEAEHETHKSGDDDADDQKGSYKFPHHETKGGPANLNACRNGLARLSGSSIPAGDQAGVKAHLQAHLDDGHQGDAEDHTHDDLSGFAGEFAKLLKEGMQ
jgi:ATP-dependent protease ClpP protease subunit